MRRGLLLLLATALALLAIVFSVYQGRSESLGGISLRSPVFVPLHEVVVRVWVVGLDGDARPDAGALVWVGLYSATTDKGGVARLTVPAGRYSTYVKSGDGRLLPLTTSLQVDRNITLDVRFKLARLSPERIRLETGSGSTTIKLYISSEEEGRMFISYPHIAALTSKGTPIIISRGGDEYSYFFQQVSRWPLEIVLQVEQEIALVEPQNTYVPLLVVWWEISA